MIRDVLLKYMRTLVKFVLILYLFQFIVDCSESTEPDQEQDNTDSFAVVGYWPEWELEQVQITVGEQLTDLLLFSIEPSDDGSLQTDRITFQMIAKSIQIQNTYKTRTMICVGGWDRSSGFSAMALDDQKRNSFIANLYAYCSNNAFSGVDFDWEFPSTQSERNAYVKLITETAALFHASGLIVTMALGSGQQLAIQALDSLDRIHLMSYDHSGRHSTYEQAVNDITQLMGRGVAKEKIVLGVPFYGRKITDSGSEISYRDIVETYHPAADTDEAGGYYFNGIATIKSKTRLALDMGLNGIMIWEIGQDAAGDESLLKTIGDAIKEDTN
jgi:chitinase